MGRRCSICTHAARKAIEAAVHAGASLVEAAALHPGVSKSSLARHMADHVAPIACTAVPDPLGYLSSPAPVRIRERPRPAVEPDAPVPPAPAGNVVQLRATPLALAGPEIEPREAPTPLSVAILLQHGYDQAQIATRFGIDEAAMTTLLAELEDAYTRQATGSSSAVMVGRLIWKAEYAIAELERLYQAATRHGRNREARECRRQILVERQELRGILRENGITRPVHPDDLFSDMKERLDRDDIMFAVRNSIDGVYEERDPVPVRKPRLIG